MRVWTKTKVLEYEKKEKKSHCVKCRLAMLEEFGEWTDLWDRCVVTGEQNEICYMKFKLPDDRIGYCGWYDCMFRVIG